MTRIDMEREWAGLPWWHRALTALTLQRGLAVANGVALAGVAFLGVATFHIAHTVLSEEEGVHTYAALPLPGLSPAVERGHLLVADASQAGGIVGTVLFPQAVLAASAADGALTPTHAATLDETSAPAWLFDPPSQKARKTSQPQFILPGERRTASPNR